jgi:sugar O-acyltransferase (sialic acid O-acetyltransferase NeuD family)
VADLCEGGSARWGVALTKVQQAAGKPRLLIVGAGGHGRSVAEAVLMADQFRLVGFADDGAFARGEAVWDLPVLGPATEFENYASYVTHAVVAIGNNVLRQKLFAQLQAAGFALTSVIHPRAMVSPRALLGSGVAVMAGAIVGTEATLGPGAIVNCGAVVDHHARVHEFGHLGVNACMAGGSVLGALAWMQAGSAIGYGVQVEAGTVLRPGEVMRTGHFDFFKGGFKDEVQHGLTRRETPRGAS